MIIAVQLPRCASSPPRRSASPTSSRPTSTARWSMVRETVRARRHAVLLRQRRQRGRRAAHGHRVRRALHAEPARVSGDRAHDGHVAAHRGGQRLRLRERVRAPGRGAREAGRPADHPLDERQLAERAAGGRGGAARRASRCSRFSARDGGALRALADHSVIIPTDRTDRAQELHLCIQHIICDIVEQTL